jgi:plastocyanin
MRSRILDAVMLSAAALIAGRAHGQDVSAPAGEVRLHLTASGPGNHHDVRAVVWLEPLPGTQAVPFPATGHYTLLQKNRMFIPHLQVVPVGAVVQFPNADPFFHNVFSLFDGRRFDLGLYEAGSSKSVTFSRKGVSYIFCNIHPEMSAVVISLSSALFAIAGADGSVTVHGAPPGAYQLRLWVEGVPPDALEKLSRHVDLSARQLDLGEVRVPLNGAAPMTHTNKFGQPYEQDQKSPY